jgi:hypothetical protein
VLPNGLIGRPRSGAATAVHVDRTGEPELSDAIGRLTGGHP